MDEQKAVEAEEAQQLMSIAFDGGIYPSPIDVQTQEARQYNKLGNIRWRHYDNVPKKMRVTNSGHTVLVSAKWNEERPYLSGGPLFGRYVFSQMHFHWGRSDEEGSEHTILGKRFPLEMHTVFFKSHYLTQEAALKQLDGMVVAVYLFEIQNEDNQNLGDIIAALSQIRQSCHSCRINPIPLSHLAPAFSTDYLLYWGSMSTESCSHAVLWILYHTLLPISKRQMSEFRLLTGISGNLILDNWRNAQPFGERLLFHIISPSYLNRAVIDEKSESAQVSSNDSNKKYFKNIMTGDNYPSETKQNFKTIFPNNLASIVAQKSSVSEFSNGIKANGESYHDHDKDYKNQDQVLVLQKVHAYYNVDTKDLKPKIKLIIPKKFESKSHELIDIFKKTDRIDASTSEENEISNVACLGNYSDDSDSDGKDHSQVLCHSCSIEMKIDKSKLKENMCGINDELNHSSLSQSAGDFISVPTAINTCATAKNSSLFPSNENIVDKQTYFNFQESMNKNNTKLANTTATMCNMPNSYNTNKDELEHKLANDFITILKPRKVTNNKENVRENEIPLSGLYTNVDLEKEKWKQSIKGTNPTSTIENEKNGYKFKDSEKGNENGSTLDSIVYHLKKISNLTNEFSQTDNDQVIKFLIYCALRYYILKQTSHLQNNSLSNNVEIVGPANHDKNKHENKNESEKLNICQENITEENNLSHFKNKLKDCMNKINDNAKSLAVNEDELELDSNILGKLLMYYYMSASDPGNLKTRVSEVLSSLSNSSSQRESEDEYNLFMSPRDNKLRNIFKHITNHSIGIQSNGIKYKNKATQCSNFDLHNHAQNKKFIQSFSFGNESSEKHGKIDRKCYTFVMDMNKFEQIRRIKNKEVKHRVFRHFSTNSLVLGRNTDQTNKLYKSLMLKLGGTERKPEINNEKHFFKNVNHKKHLSKNTKNIHSHAHDDSVKCLFRGVKNTAKIDKHDVENTKRQKGLKSSTKKHSQKKDGTRQNPEKKIKVGKFCASPMAHMIHVNKQAENSGILKAPLHQCVTNKSTGSNYSLFHHIKQILNWTPEEI